MRLSEVVSRVLNIEKWEKKVCQQSNLEAYWQLCCSVAQSCPTLCDPMDCSTPDFRVLSYLLELAQSHVRWVGDAIPPSHPSPPLLLPSVLPSIRVFSNELGLPIWKARSNHSNWDNYWYLGNSFCWSYMEIFFKLVWLFFSIQLETSSYADRNDGNRCIRNQRRQEAGVRDLGKLWRKFITVSTMSILHVCGQPLKVRPVRMGLQIPSSLLPLKDTGVP